MALTGFAATIANDYQVVDDNQSSIAYTAGPATLAPVTYAAITGVFKRPITRKEAAAGNGFFDGSETVFEIPVVQLNAGAYKPVEGDKIVDAAGVAWSVLTSELVTLDTVWNVYAKEQR